MQIHLRFRDAACENLDVNGSVRADDLMCKRPYTRSHMLVRALARVGVDLAIIFSFAGRLSQSNCLTDVKKSLTLKVTNMRLPLLGLATRERSVISIRDFFFILAASSTILRIASAREEGRSVRAASRLQCAESPLRRAFEMADLAAFLSGGHGGG